VGDIERIERIGGHPAVDFVNTLGGLLEAPDDEYLLDYTDLVSFVEGSGLLDSTTSDRLRRVAELQLDQARDVLKRTLQLRASLDRALRAQLENGTPPGPDLEDVRQAYLTALARATLQPSGSHYEWAWPDADDTLDQPLWILASQAIELLRSAPLHRLTRCGHCRWMFLDSSKNHSRRWCSMNACGSIVKMRRYRAAHRPKP
jgi:predicted RNA-binding Zn ribbon-like protein